MGRGGRLGALLSKDPAWRAAYVDRAERMVQRDKNHPSIILWSLGNEFGYGPNHAAMTEAIRALDPTRPIHYESAYDAPDEDAAVDLISRMYTDVPGLIAEGQKADEPKPVLPVRVRPRHGQRAGQPQRILGGRFTSTRACSAAASGNGPTTASVRRRDERRGMVRLWRRFRRHAQRRQFLH